MTQDTISTEKWMRQLARVAGDGYQPIWPETLRAWADEIERLRSMTVWQPIETAPKDGTWVLGWWPSRDTVAQMRWGRESRLTVEHWHYLGGWTPAHEPTHWLPLPTPPEADT